MRSYKYRAQDKDGRIVSGRMQSNDVFDLQSRLKQEEKYLISYKEKAVKVRSRRLRSDVLSDFARNIGELLGAGVTLVKTIRIMAEDETISSGQREIYNAVLKQLKAGASLADAMQEQGNTFPPLLINMFRSAENAGNLDLVSRQMAIYYDKDHRLTQKVNSALTYPKILCCLIIAAVIVIMKYVIPQFQDLFAVMDSLPAATTILLGISGFVERRWYVLIFAAFVIFVLVRVLVSIPQVRYRMDQLEIHLPVVGRLRKVIYTARFARSLSSLYCAGIPIVSCLQIARTTIGNAYIESQFDEVIHTIQNGGKLSEATGKVDGFTGKLASAVMVGEETGAMGNMLVSVADQMEYDSEIALNKLVSYLEPVMIILMAVIVGFVMIAVIQPIYGSYGSIAARNY